MSCWRNYTGSNRLGGTHMASFLLAISASLCWGVSDFLGGLKTRTVPVLRVLVISQPAGLVLVTLAVILWSHHRLPSGSEAVLAMAAGALSIAALGFLYAAMTKGSMIVVVPLASTGAIIPVVIGIIRGNSITTLAAVGIALALIGAPAAAWEPNSEARTANGLLGAVLAIAAGTASGTWFTLMDLASKGNPLGATEVMRLTACVIALGLFVCYRARKRSRAAADAQMPEIPAAEPDGASPPRRGTTTVALAPRRAGTASMTHRLVSQAAVRYLAIVGIGLTDAMAEIFFTSASTSGQLSIISPLSSLYPAVTVLLAAAVLRERVHPVQAMGAACAMTGALLLAL
jgi:drug/metabolite transporter (DMT)-like permease